ncbi:uncharacterized protein LOC130990592 [Salvia miltiorrhiza]|uniref:uncharacterized protein LOC130990592 n=1 Tax=Salvia miltiorrhiza TaxID=226208 RepID=UPI0025AD5F14|nr:uncharacterized protein LOC130990592 [Salvia miltiorrhiza]
MGAGETGRWFEKNLKRKIGDGGNTKFWLHAWKGEQTLKSLFPRLFLLSNKKNGNINEMGEWIDERWVWNLNWSRELLDREVEASRSLLNHISGFYPLEGSADKWIWRAHKEGVYTAKSAYQAIREQREERMADPEEMKSFADLWDTPAPQKVRVTAWRVFRNRLPTCDNLTRRNVLLGEVEKGCVACFYLQESTTHLFVECPKSK